MRRPGEHRRRNDLQSCQAPGESILNCPFRAPGEPVLDALRSRPGGRSWMPSGRPGERSWMPPASPAFEPILDAVPATALVTISGFSPAAPGRIRSRGPLSLGPPSNRSPPIFLASSLCGGGLLLAAELIALTAHLVGALRADDFSFFGHGKALSGHHRAMAALGPRQIDPGIRGTPLRARGDLGPGRSRKTGRTATPSCHRERPGGSR